MRLIDVDKLIADVNNRISDSWKRAVFKSLIAQQPEIKAPFEPAVEIKVDEKQIRKALKESLKAARRRPLTTLQPEPEVEYSGWIPVKERMPEKSTPMLITTSWGEIDIATFYGYSDEDGWSTDNANLEMQEVIAWRPLPEPYQEEE